VRLSSSSVTTTCVMRDQEMARSSSHTKHRKAFFSAMTSNAFASVDTRHRSQKTRQHSLLTHDNTLGFITLSFRRPLIFFDILFGGFVVSSSFPHAKHHLFSSFPTPRLSPRPHRDVLR